jgi:hypothetical protein
MTIYDCLKEKLGREPTHQELVAKVKAIIREARDNVATKRGK